MVLDFLLFFFVLTLLISIGHIPVLKNPFFSFFFGIYFCYVNFEQSKFIILGTIIFSFFLLMKIKPKTNESIKTQQGNSGYIIGSIIGIVINLLL